MRNLIVATLLLTGFTLCSCASYSFPRVNWAAGETIRLEQQPTRPYDRQSDPFIEDYWHPTRRRKDGRRRERYGGKVIRAYAGYYYGTHNGVGFVYMYPYRGYGDGSSYINEFSFEAFQGTHTFSDEIDKLIRYRIRYSTVRLLYSLLVKDRHGFFAGGGWGGEMGEINQKETDFNLDPPAVHRNRPFIVELFVHGKVGFDTGHGFYAEAGINFGTAHFIFGVNAGAELGVGFYY